MTSTELNDRCWAQYKHLLDANYGNLAMETAKGSSEVLEEKYTDTLPLTIAQEYRAFLASLWEANAPSRAPSFDQLVTTRRASEVTQEDYDDFLGRAREQAETVTLWERITHTNHKDITFYKGLLKQYTEELLRVLMEDFLNDAEGFFPKD